MIRPAHARLSLLTLLAVVLVALVAAGCGGDVVPEPEHVTHASLALRSEKQDGREVGLPWLDPAIARPEAEGLRNAFSWASTTPLRELDADGAPALYYAAIYIASREERAVLDLAQIHHSFMPLFSHEQDKWHGKRGKIAASTDGKGAFLFTVIPGKIYNLIRQWALDGDPLFAAVVLRPIPQPMQNAQGSLSYQELAKARFRYRGMDPIRPAANGEKTGTTKQKLILSTARAALKAIAEAAEEVVRDIAIELGNIDRDGTLFGWGAAGSVKLRLTLEVHDTDPSFGGNVMRRAWGTQAGTPVQLPGVRVSVWSHGDGTVLWLPTLFEATTNAASVAELNLAKDRGVRQLCIATENEAAEITDLLTEVEVCDFEDDVNKSIDNLKYDTWATVTVQDGYFNILAQATEGRAYLRDVVGYTPHQATINVGFIADAMGKVGTGAPFMPCLGFPNLSADVLVLDFLGWIAAIPVIGPPLAVTLAAATPLLAVDGFFPEGDAMNSRGAATHEYGHFAMCSMLYDANASYITTSWTNAVFSRISSGGALPSATESPAYDIEAFADFFAGQVVGGTNYFKPGTLTSGIMSYCDVNASDPTNCLDRNFATQSSFTDQVGRVATTLHDAFDGDRYNSSFVNQPGNGNVWTSSSGTFVYGNSRNGDKYDEPVLLPGAAIRTFVGKLSSLDQTKFMTSLAETIRQNGYNWCDACRVFSIHQGVDPTAAAADHYAACAQAPLSTWLGPAPDTTSPTSCNFSQCPYPLVQVGPSCQACAANQISVNGTTCLTCPPEAQVVDNKCEQCNAAGVCQPYCLERQHMVGNVCEDCQWAEISVNGQCQPCPPGQYRYENTCVTTCPPYLDETIIVDGVCTYRLD